MAKFFDCPKCDAPRAKEDHCTSPTCEWAYCEACNHITDLDSGRTMSRKRPKDGRMQV